MTQVWPGLVVSPETVNKRVNLLREALGDDAREPRYIVGVRSRGYRLIAPVSRRSKAVLPSTLPARSSESAPTPPGLPDSLIPIEAPPAESPKSQSPMRRWAVLSGAAIGLLVVAAIAVRWTGRHPAEVRHPDVHSASDHRSSHWATIAHCGRTALRQHQRGSCGCLSGAGPAGDDSQPIVAHQRTLSHITQFLFRASHQKHGLARDRSAPAFRLLDRRQRATRGGSPAGRGATRGYGRRYPGLVRTF